MSLCFMRNFKIVQENDLNKEDTTPLPYVCISKMCSRHSLTPPSMESSPELGVFMNVRLILKAMYGLHQPT